MAYAEPRGECFGERRGPYEEARLLYDDLTPEQPKERLSAYDLAMRDRGAGRPTKKERRETDRLKPDFDTRED